MSGIVDSQTLTLHLMGGFRITAGHEEVAELNHARLQELLAYLLLHRERPIARQHLAFLFWPDSTEKQARTNLRTLWHRLRRTLPDADRFLAADELTMQWRDDASFWLDVAEFEAHLKQARSAAGIDDQVLHLEQAIAHYGGDLLPGCYSDWLLAERDRLAQAFGNALEQVATLHESRRNYPQAIGHAQALLRHDPLHEPAYTQLMRLHALNDDRAAALHTFHTCTTILRRELDVEPGRQTRELYERLLNVDAHSVVLPQFEATIPLVGRDAEWVLLQRAWREAAGRPRLMLISGEAGIGKTRLAEALAEWVGRQGIPALAARCYATEGELAYAPIVAWLAAQPRPLLAAPWLRELARLLPEILVERPDLPPPEPLTENWQRLRMFEAVTRALFTGRAATLLFLDDLQWCDRDTLDWLGYLLQAGATQASSGRGQVLIVATVRLEDAEGNSALDPWKAGLSRAGQLAEIELGPLSQEATSALADRVAGRPLDRALGPALFRSSEGNPLFIVEMVRAGFEPTVPATADHAAAMVGTPAALPAKVRRVIEARLAQLSPDARSVIELAAVIGRAFSFGVLAAASALSEDLLVGCLDECWRKRILREQGDDAYDFSHDKLREVAYAGVSRTRRRWLHGQVARALELVHTTDLDRAAGMIAGHFEAARLPAQAIAYYDRAAAAARGVYAHHEALDALDKANSLLDALPDQGTRRELEAHMLEEIGDLREFLTQHIPARNAYVAALACAPHVDTVARARLHRKIGKTLDNERVDLTQVAAHYETAETLLGTPDRDAAETTWWDEWCQVQLEHLILLYWWGRPGDLGERIARVRPLIERHGTPAQRASLFENLNRQLNRRQRYAPSDDALDNNRAVLAALPASASPEQRAPHQFTLGFNLLWHGDLAEAEATLRSALDTAEQTGDVSLQVRCLTYLGVVCRRQGRDAEMEPIARRGLGVAEAAGILAYIGANRAGLAWVAWRRNNLPAAERLAQAALDAWRLQAMSYPFSWQALWPLIGVAVAQDRIADAVIYARRLCEPDQQVLPPQLEALLTAAAGAWDAGRPDEARDFLNCALAMAQKSNLS